MPDSEAKLFVAKNLRLVHRARSFIRQRPCISERCGPKGYKVWPEATF